MRGAFRLIAMWRVVVIYAQVCLALNWLFNFWISKNTIRYQHFKKNWMTSQCKEQCVDILILTTLTSLTEGFAVGLYCTFQMYTWHQIQSCFSFNRYFLDRKEEGINYFRVDEYSGVIYTTLPLDREDMPWHNITVMASEVGRYPGCFPYTKCLQEWVHVMPLVHLFTLMWMFMSG